MAIFEKIKIGNEKEIRLFNIPLVQYACIQKKDYCKKYYDLFPNRGFREEIFEKIIRQYDDKTFLLTRHGMGETYILANIIDKIPEYQNVNIISNRAYVKDVFSIFSPNTKVNYLEIADFHHYFDKEKYRYKGRTFYIYLTPQYFNEMNEKFLNNEIDNYYANLIEKYSLSETELTFKQPEIDEIFEKELLERLEGKFNLKNTIIIFPEALSATEYSLMFWRKLILELKNKGYKVYVNSKNGNEYNPGQSKEFFTVKEIFYMVKNCAGVVGLRSGLLETFIQLGKPLHVIYTSHPFRQNLIPEKYIDTHSLKKLPFENSQITEYDALKYSAKKILKDISEAF